MGLKGFGSKLYAGIVHRKIKRWSTSPLQTQDVVFRNLISKARNTWFGIDHGFELIENYEQFKTLVPVRDYEGLKPYVDLITEKGEKDVLWPGLPKYFAKTSGTTSGSKYIPITKESTKYHFKSASEAFFNYAHLTGDASFFDGKLIFLSGSPEMTTTGPAKILTGRLSGIVNHFIPSIFKGNQVPSWETNCIEDWETKVDAIVKETIGLDMRLISGIPPWMQMYFDKVQEKTGKNITDVFPKLSVIGYGGVNFEPYKAQLTASLGKVVEGVETYPASEGFIAYQDIPDSMKVCKEDEGMLLLLNNGIFYEFIPVDEFYQENPTRISIKDVKIGVNYAIILNTNAGLWGYNIGDTVAFTSTNPYRIKVTGRLKQYISAFGEHVIVSEVEGALMEACKNNHVQVTEFTVAPKVVPDEGEGLPYHEWFIEFEKEPQNMDQFRKDLDASLQSRNSYYLDLIQGNILQTCVVRNMQKNAFIEYMKSMGKLGGQHKVPRIANDRKIADELLEYINN